MKYIRTKDGRISYLIREPDEEICDYEIITSKGTRTYCDESEVIKTADNLEELFDTKVAIRKSDHKPYSGHFSGPFFFQEGSGWLGRVDSYEIIYGAIFTNKGIIYKAKMNDKGEWELL